MTCILEIFWENVLKLKIQYEVNFKKAPAWNRLKTLADLFSLAIEITSVLFKWKKSFAAFVKLCERRTMWALENAFHAL